MNVHGNLTTTINTQNVYIIKTSKLNKNDWNFCLVSVPFLIREVLVVEPLKKLPKKKLIILRWIKLKKENILIGSVIIFADWARGDCDKQRGEKLQHLQSAHPPRVWGALRRHLESSAARALAPRPPQTSVWRNRSRRTSEAVCLDARLNSKGIKTQNLC